MKISFIDCWNNITNGNWKFIGKRRFIFTGDPPTIDACFDETLLDDIEGMKLKINEKTYRIHKIDSNDENNLLLVSI